MFIIICACMHTAGVRASVGDFMAANNFTLTQKLLFCQKPTQQPHHNYEHFLQN